MHCWKNTATLDPYVPELAETVDPAEAELAVVGSKALDWPNMPRLRGVFKCGVGLDNLDPAAMHARGIQLGLPSASTRAFIYEETANFAVHLIFQLLYAEVGDLENWRKFPRPFLGQRAVLVVGAGNIGARVAHKLSTCCRVLTYDRATDAPEVFSRHLAEADVVTLHVPLDEATRGFFDADRLALMKNGAGLVNTARGPLVDEEALLAELSRGRLRAAFDVFWQEPYRGKLASLPAERFRMSPHVASANEDFLHALADDFIRFRDALSGTQ